MPWERSEGWATNGFRTYAGVLIWALIIAAAWGMALRLAGGLSQRKLDYLFACAGAVGLALMLIFYATQIGRADNSWADAKYEVGAGIGFFVSATALALISCLVIVRQLAKMVSEIIDNHAQPA